ncbi:hypothetical protein WDW89_03480 [Deltaproteobacteria bacterium TL4]
MAGANKPQPSKEASNKPKEASNKPKEASNKPKEASSRPASSKPALGQKKLKCYEFQFEARSKPNTEQVLDAEKKKLGALFGKKPKASIAQIIDVIEGSVETKIVEEMIHECTHFYKNLDAEGHQYLEIFGRLLLEGASKEQGNFPRQRFLIYQALDTLSAAVQAAPKRIYPPAESLIVSIFKITSDVSSSTFFVEKEIHKEMDIMLNKKKDINDLPSHDKIIKLCFQGKRYYEAYYHLVEYEKIMQISSRSMHLQKAGEIAFRKGSVFQHMIDFYVNVAAGKEEKDKIIDHGKLRSFISRFNADHPRAKIQPLTGTGPLQINKTIASLIAVSNNYYNQAGADERFSQCHKAYYCKAFNLMYGDQGKAAIENLISGLAALKKANLKSIVKGNETIKMLEYLITVSKDHGSPRKVEDYQKELAELRNIVRGMESKKRESEGSRKQKLPPEEEF